MRWPYRDQGELEIWQNDRSILRREGLQTYNDFLGPYLKIGVYVYVPIKGWREKRRLHRPDRCSLLSDALDIRTCEEVDEAA